MKPWRNWHHYGTYIRYGVHGRSVCNYSMKKQEVESWEDTHLTSYIFPQFIQSGTPPHGMVAPHNKIDLFYSVINIPAKVLKIMPKVIQNPGNFTMKINHHRIEKSYMHISLHSESKMSFHFYLNSGKMCTKLIYVIIHLFHSKYSSTIWK